MMNVAEYTTSIYDITLTTQSIDSTSSLLYGTESSYTFTSSESGSLTYWVSSLQDSRSVSSSTSSTTGLTSYSESFTVSLDDEISTTATTIYNTQTYRGKTGWQDTYIDTWSRSMVSLSFSHTGITSIVSVSSYGDYTYRSTTYSNKTRIDTTVTSSIHRTVANKESSIVSVSQTDSWIRTLGSYSTTTDIECIISKGVASSLIYAETGSTINIGNEAYNTSATILTSLEAERVSGTLYNSTAERTWTSSIESKDTIPAGSMRFTSMWLDTYTDWKKDEFTYLVSSSKVTTSNTSSVSYLSATFYPQEYVYSISSETHSFIHEWISYTLESTAGPLYLGSQTLSIISQFSTTTFLSETYSLSWIDKEDSWSASDASPQVIQGLVSVGSRFRDNNYVYDTTIMDWQGTDYVMTTTTKRGYVDYETSVREYTSWEHRFSTTYSATTSSSSTGSSSTWFSSTTYTGQFGIHSISTTLSNYSSIVSTSSSGKSDSKIVDIKDFDFGESSYTEYYGSGSTTHPAI